MKRLITGAVAVAAALVLWIVLQPGAPETSQVQGIEVPELSSQAIAGQAIFDANCAICHGPFATGSDKGPPLIHVIYEPSHHGDMSFVMAAQNGVRSHHWQFGDMPPVPGVTPDDVVQIVAFVREVQRANGIH